MYRPYDCCPFCGGSVPCDCQKQSQSDSIASTPPASDGCSYIGLGLMLFLLGCLISIFLPIPLALRGITMSREQVYLGIFISALLSILISMMLYTAGKRTKKPKKQKKHK